MTNSTIFDPSEQARQAEGAGDSARIWSVPHARNPRFTGRDLVLEELHRVMSFGRSTARLGQSGPGQPPPEPAETVIDPTRRFQAVYGLGGVGKTQLALEYAYRYRDDYRLVWWLPAADDGALGLSYLRLAARLGVDTGADTGRAPVLDRVRTDVQRALDNIASGGGNWLLIFDNASGPEQVRPFLPEPTGHVLITSRTPNWGTLAGSFCLRVWQRHESVAFLARRTGLNDPQGAARLSLALGDLPLAMEQAAATIEQARLSYADYLTRFEDHWAELLRSGRPSGDYPDTVAMTWELAFRQLEEANPRAVDLLTLCAFFAPIEIPRSMLREHADVLPAPLAAAVRNVLTFDGMVATLLGSSLVDADLQSITLHRLVAALTRDRLNYDQYPQWCQAALNVADRAFAFHPDDVRGWAKCAAVLPHALAAARYADAAAVGWAQVAKLANRAGEYLFHTGQYAQARSVLEWTIGVAARVWGPDNPRMSAVANNLGRVLKRLGEHKAAAAHFQAARAADEAAYGVSHPHVAEAANNLGTVLHETGDIEGARRQFEWALAVCETHYGPEHAKVAAVVNNLGYALSTLGDVDRGLEHFTRALATAEAACGPDHPTVASIRANLGVALRLKGDVQGAREQFRSAASVAESSLGEDHPDVARYVTYLGLAAQDEGDLDAARGHFERAVSIQERTLGPLHMNVVMGLNYLARCLKAMDRVDESVECYDRATAILRQRRLDGRTD